jgi:hypothetical protein
MDCTRDLGNWQREVMDLKNAQLPPKASVLKLDPTKGATKEKLLEALCDLLGQNGSAILGVNDWNTQIRAHAIVLDELKLTGQAHACLDKGAVDDALKAHAGWARIRDPYHGWEVAITLDALNRLWLSRVTETHVVQVAGRTNQQAPRH